MWTTVLILLGIAAAWIAFDPEASMSVRLSAVLGLIFLCASVWFGWIP